ncbi:metal-dependent hydrolase [Planomicrobium chinense]|uniref:metal-dependent hydrolase n=1 Tax=Planococcus chinensis TaxID=272917 RepID=UPI001CC7BBBD|nr:metal-dependent hydrolase [Planococcus chinensis]MBZ5201114.1 metal-dependent hydrolase [Planococcus chinensis]MCP2035174.1 L-ascorbate metabolism protein UlaG (beta-lactamase superfamily) [Planomicrobium sp. HSC-17F08]
MQVSYHGHSVVKIKTGNKTILIDPFISGNSLTDLTASEEKPDVILLTHAHNDHVGDTIDLAKTNDAQVVAPVELANYLGSQGLNTIGMNLGGSYEFDFGTVKYTKAFHSSSYTTEEGDVIYGGMPAGLLFKAEGKTVYHAGDTEVFGDMAIIGERNAIDVAFVPIGDFFTMGPEDAAYAVELLKPKTVVPIHYNTFPPIKQDPEKFKALVKNAEVNILQAGGTIDL